MDEAHPLEPTTPYAAAKCGADRLIAAFVETYGLPALIVRPFNTYGPGQHPEKLVARVLTAAIDGERAVIHGTGEAARDWTYVDEVAETFVRLLDAPKERVIGEVLNVGTGRAVSVRDVVALAMAACGRDRPEAEHVPDRPGQVLLHQASVDKLETLLGFRPGLALEDGLARAADWYRANTEWWRPLRWMESVTLGAAGTERRW